MAYAGLVTGGWAGLVCLVLYGIARLFGVPMEVDTMDGVAVVPWFLVLLIPVVAGVIGAIAAWATGEAELSTTIQLVVTAMMGAFIRDGVNTAAKG
ncbi:MAG: hypothetical protein ACO2YP_11260 [Pseudomonadales bacterium]